MHVITSSAPVRAPRFFPGIAPSPDDSYRHLRNARSHDTTQRVQFAERRHSAGIQEDAVPYLEGNPIRSRALA